MHTIYAYMHAGAYKDKDVHVCVCMDVCESFMLRCLRFCCKGAHGDVRVAHNCVFQRVGDPLRKSFQVSAAGRILGTA